MNNNQVISILLLFWVNVFFFQGEIQKSKTTKKNNCEAFFSIAGLTQYGSIKKQDLLNQNCATIKWSSQCKEGEKVRFKIVSFEIRALINGSSQSAISNKECFSIQQKELIKKLKVGGFIHFEQIKVMAPDGLRTMSPSYYKIE